VTYQISDRRVDPPKWAVLLRIGVDAVMKLNVGRADDGLLQECNPVGRAFLARCEGYGARWSEQGATAHQLDVKGLKLATTPDQFRDAFADLIDQVAARANELERVPAPPVAVAASAPAMAAVPAGAGVGAPPA
jgi:hypothetical protein